MIPPPDFHRSQSQQWDASLWGQSDGRTTTMRGPTVLRAIDVMRTTLTRVVLAPNGTVIHSDTVRSSYKTVPSVRAQGETTRTASKAG